MKKIIKYFLIVISSLVVIIITALILIWTISNNERKIAKDFTLLSSSGKYNEATELMHNALKKEFTLESFEKALSLNLDPENYFYAHLIYLFEILKLQFVALAPLDYWSSEKGEELAREMKKNDGILGGVIVMLYFYLPISHQLWHDQPEHFTNRIEAFGLYWHFVDLVWIFLFPVLYLL